MVYILRLYHIELFSPKKKKEKEIGKNVIKCILLMRLFILLLFYWHGYWHGEGNSSCWAHGGFRV
jgi:hypothetical protein